MNWFNAFLLGIVEGITEFLPISSTGHMILVSNALGLENNEFLKLFEIVIQTGAIAAVIILFAKELIRDKSLWPKLTLAFIPTGIFGLLFNGIIKQYLFNPLVVCGALFFGSFILLSLETISAKIKHRELKYFDYLLIGIFQCLAFIPGISRSAATIMGAIFLGGKREEAVKFSFLLAIPTIIAASGYSIIKMKQEISSDQYALLFIGFATAFVAGFFSVKLFMKWLNHRTFMICGLYRLLLSIVYFFVYL